MKLRILRLIFDIVSQKTERLELLGVDKELLDTLEFPRMLKGTKKEEVDLATNFCILLLHHDKHVTTSDMVGFDMESWDILSKTEMKKVWQALNAVGSNEVADAIDNTGPTPTYKLEME